MEHISDYATDFVKEHQQKPHSFTVTAPCERTEVRSPDLQSGILVPSLSLPASLG